MKYNYYEVVKADAVDAIKEYMEYNGITSVDDIDDGALVDELFVTDSVTGNASGSYTCNSWMAEENVCHNLDLLQNALEEFGDDGEDLLKRGAEEWDVTIRCWVLFQVFQEALDEVAEEMEEAEEETEE